jgi:hypothetical protein
VKRVRFAPTVEENSPTPVLSRPSSIRPTFDLEFDFDSLASPAHSEGPPPLKSNEPSQWKDAFLSDLHTAKKNPSASISSPSSTIPMETQMPEDTLWDFMKESNPELLERLERANQEKQKRSDRFSTQQSSSAPRSNVKMMKVIVTPDAPGIHVFVSGNQCSCHVK